MNTDFEKILDDVLRKWKDSVGNYPWEEMFGGSYGNDVKLHVLNRLSKDGLMKQVNNGTVAMFGLTPEGYDVKRNIDLVGYVAQKIKSKEKEEREIQLFHLSKKNLQWTIISAIIFFATLIVTIISLFKSN